jgi:outer membrane protein OmpA-like peptidoglycan-associated protein
MKKRFLSIAVFMLVGAALFAQGEDGGAGSSSSSSSDPNIGKEFTVYYPADSANFADLDPKLREQNKQQMDQLSKLLNDNPRYRVRAVGHANPTLGTKTEQEETLIPLSRQRAREASRILEFIGGISLKRIIIDGVGNRFALTSENDRDNGWMNRRVVFIIIDE